MALKGSAKIELTNADGTKNVVEHGNMITDAVNDLLYASRGEQSNIMRICNNGDSFVEQMFGGILLFKDTLSSDPADYYIPSVNTVGYASKSAYSGIDTERGSYNETESGIQEDGSYKLVYDFTTSQANGTIQSIALCTNMMGKIGMSNNAVSSEKVSATTLRNAISPYNAGNLLPNSGNTNGLNNYGYNIVAAIGNTAYAVHRDNLYSNGSNYIKNNGGILKVFRFDVCSGWLGLKSIVGMARYIDCIDVQLPADFISGLSSAHGYYNADYYYEPLGKKLILCPCYTGGNLQKNSSIKYVEIEFENNMNVTLHTFTNNADGYIWMSSYSQSAYDEHGYYKNLYITKDYIVTNVVVSTRPVKNKLYVTKKSDNTDIKEVRFANGNEFYFDNSSNNVNSVHKNNLRLIFSFGNIFVFGITGDYSTTKFLNAYILDMSTGLMKEINANEMTYRSNIPLSNNVTWGRTGQYLALSITVNPFVLCTKNNLDSPVTKTASQTMKITYTLREE